MTMPDPLESLSDGELSEVFAVEVMRAWRESPTSKTIWYRGKPVKLKFATSTDAVMPWLDKWHDSEPQRRDIRIVRRLALDWLIILRTRVNPWDDWTDEIEQADESLSRAICSALIRSARATQQDCGVRE